MLELLYVYADTNGDGEVERIPLFSNPLYNYFGIIRTRDYAWLS
jgi:hypothetical protein